MKNRIYTICQGCPCLNSDYEQGSYCNLDFSTDLEWFRKSNGEKVEDTPEMRKHQEDFELYYASTNCGLIEIKTIKEIIKPITNLERTNLWNAMS